ncbi:MAG: NAD-glutamate dehydrogenase [Acidimicrobiales bacterium]
MTTRLEAAKAELVGRVDDRIARRLGGRASLVQTFLHLCLEGVDPDDLLGRNPEDVYGAVLSLCHLASDRSAGAVNLAVYAPEPETHGWQSPHTVVDLVTDDMPFLVDSVTMELNRHDLGIHLVILPVMSVRRDDSGRLLEVAPPTPSDAAGSREAVLHVEVDRVSDPALVDRLRTDLTRVLGDLRAAVDDWQAMRAKVAAIGAELGSSPPPVDPEEVDEAKALLEWIAADHFTFLGYREYRLERGRGGNGGDVEGARWDVLRSLPGSGLGVLRKGEETVTELSPDASVMAREPEVLVLTKANARATVHRSAHLDYIGIKSFDPGGGEVVGERRFLGLYTETAYSASVAEVPVLRRKVHAVVRRAGFPPGTHAAKNLLTVLENYPRDELFATGEDELTAIAVGITRIEERKQVRLFVRRDPYGRFWSCFVYLPRDRYTTAVRRRMEAVLLSSFAGTYTEHTVSMSDSVLVRLHFIVHTSPDRPHPGVEQRPEVDQREAERRLAEASRSWEEDLRDALIDRFGEEEGLGLLHRYQRAFPAAYVEDFSARAAVADIKRLEALRATAGPGVDMSLWRRLEAADESVRFKVLRAGSPISLSDILPLLEHMGVRVVDEHPYEVRPLGSPGAWIYDFGLQPAGGSDVITDEAAERFREAFARVWAGRADNDSFNRLVLLAGLDWRQVTTLRAGSKYLRQTGTPFSQAYIEETLAAHPDIARQLVELWQARLDPGHRPSGKPISDDVTVKGLVSDIEAAVDAVASLDEDRILRRFLRLWLAVQRTNYYQGGHYQGGEAPGAAKDYLSFKVDPAAVPGMQLPLPAHEIFVYSPRTEGVHLRGADVARGGLRWSDRREDFRTEVLGLMKAQTVKNAVIVPMGAKGGFVVKRPPAGGSREEQAEEVVTCYRTFISGLLDLTDNIVGDDIVHPPDTVRYDGDDPYLVVAADKGTATFSDVANAISLERGFWLGDAFASGGSSGYDHKKMGITARGAWESVKRHFYELGVETATNDFTVVGVGDMSGDVFGNGMLLSDHIKLVAAFDHRHIFVDPDPDPVASLAERRRLFELPRSSWADYNSDLLSEGGGVYPRSAKSITLSPETQDVLGVAEVRMAPNDVIRAMLRAPVDLFWNGGIGTYVKASTESHADAHDRSSDALRVDATELRFRVVGEGGNLGLTQRARIELALAGSQVNTDAVDNSAGVDCSDHEVNLKIVLNRAVGDGDLTVKQRDALLAEMTEEVAAQVLRDNIDQTQALSNAKAGALAMVDVHARYLRRLVAAGRLDRDLEALPTDEELSNRAADGHGLTAPELAVVLAYTKIQTYDELLASEVPADSYLHKELLGYFPSLMRERFGDQIAGHPLRREIIATALANATVNRAGISFLFRMGEETGAGVPDVVKAHLVAKEVFGLDRLWAEVEAAQDQVAALTQTSMFLEARKLIERATRWLLRNRRQPMDIESTVEFFSPGVQQLADQMPRYLSEIDRETLARSVAELELAGVEGDLAGRIAALDSMFSALDIVDVAAQLGAAVDRVAQVYFAIGERLELDWLQEQIVQLPRGDRWQALARGALRDDLYHQHASLTADVLRRGSGDAEEQHGAPRTLVEAWASRNQSALARSLTLLADIKSAGSSDLATLCVALREVRDLVEVRHQH